MTRPYTRRRDLAVHVCRRLAKLGSAYDEVAEQKPKLYTLSVGALVLELDNLIIQSLRAYALMVVREAQAAGRITIDGRARFCLDDEFPTIVKLAISAQPSFSNVTFAVDRKNEIKIRDPNKLRGVMQVVAGHVPQSFLNAMALNCSVFSELRDLRNFYAHRCENTFRSAMHSNQFFARGLIRHPDQFVAERLPGRNSPKFKDWIAETETFFAVAV